MTACVVESEGKYFVVTADWDIDTRKEALAAVEHKKQRGWANERVIPYDNWGDAIYAANSIGNGFVRDFSDQRPRPAPLKRGAYRYA